MQVTIEVVLSALGALVALVATGLAWRFRDARGVAALVAFNAAVVVWTAGNAVQIASTTLFWKLVWVKVQYVGIVVLPVAGFAFAGRFAGRERLARPRVLAAVAAPLAALLLLSLTDDPMALDHGLVRETATLASEPGVLREEVTVVERTWGVAFGLGWLYSQLVNLVASALVLYEVYGAGNRYRRQVAALTVGALVPWVGQLLFLAGLSPVEPEVFFSVAGLAFVYAIVRHRFLELQPVARDVVVETLADGVVVLDERGVIVDANTAGERVLGSDLVGRDAAAALGDHPELLAAYRGGVQTSTSIPVDGSERRYEVRVLELAEAAAVEGTVVVLSDVTALTERERELELKNRRLEEFTSLVSHDLRGPLSVANGYVAMEREEHDSDRLHKTDEALGRMEDIIEDLLALAREGERVEATEPVALSAAAKAAWEHVETGDATLAADTDRAVMAVRGRLLRALENLFANAVAHGDVDTVRVRATPDGFAVADDGTGFDDPEEAFEWGFTTGDSGTGYGLPIVRRIADAHGWSVEAGASEAGGAEVRFNGVEWDGD